MLSVAEALQLVLAHASVLPPREVPLAETLGLVVAADVASDIDSPPHDKSIVDGYAVVAETTRSPAEELVVLEEVTAGTLPKQEVRPGTATRIMTGAPLPAGADAVVMVEKTELIASSSGQRVRICESPVRAGQNIVRRAASLSCGDVVLRAGKLIRAIEIGLLAEVGKASVFVHPRPSVANIATGNELVAPDRKPAPSEIRNSNGPMLAALTAQAGGYPVELGIARDTEASLREKIAQGLASDVLILSGGVSAGVLDLVPQVLSDLGVAQVFHKVNLKPGKPLWFGTRTADERTTLVFGLPGNPVSSLVCFELFVRPAIAKLAGRSPSGLPESSARLSAEHRQRGERPSYWPAKLEPSSDGSVVTPLAWKGSGDLRTLTDADCLAFFPAGDKVFACDESITIIHL